MKSYRTLAWRELCVQKVTSILILIAVVLSTVITTVIGQSLGILNAMKEQQAAALAGKKYGSFVQLSEEQLAEVKSDSRFSYVGAAIDLGTIQLNSQLKLSLVEYLNHSYEMYPAFTELLEGRLPEHPMEIALSEDVLRFLGFQGKSGDRISLTASKSWRHGILPAVDYTEEFTLTGITKSNYVAYTYGMLPGIVGEGTASRLFPSEQIYYVADFCTADKKTMQSTVEDVAENLQIPELDVTYNIVYLSAVGIPYENPEGGGEDGMDVSFLKIAGIMVGDLVLLASGLVIYNVLKISVSKRTKEYGVLRAIGGGKDQLWEIVFRQILFLCAAGIPVGMLAGYFSAESIFSMATSFVSPEIFMVNDTAGLKELIRENSAGKPLFLAASAFLTLFFAFAAAVPAVRYAGKVAPTVAMSGGNTKIRRRNRRTKRIKNFAAYYARLNLRRSPGRTAITILSLVMSISVFIALQSFTSLLNAASLMEEMRLGDYSIINETAGFTEKDLDELSQNDAVESVAAIQFSLYDTEELVAGMSPGFELKPGETLQVVGFNEMYMDAYTEGKLSEEEFQRLMAGEGCVIKNPFPVVYEGEELEHSEFAAGDTVSIKGRELPVMAAFDGTDGFAEIGNQGFTNGVQVIVSDRIYSELTGKSEYQEMLPTLKETADRNLFDRTVEELCREIPGTTYLSYEDTDRQLEESYEQIRLLAWGLILFVGLIGLLNIVNTVYTNIHTRVTEIGMQRAIGMSHGALYQTFLWEGAYYGIIAAVIGGMTGYICTIFVEAARTDTIQLVSIPVVSLAEAAVMSVLACLIATCIPLRRIAKMSIVDSIETVE